MSRATVAACRSGALSMSVPSRSRTIAVKRELMLTVRFQWRCRASTPDQIDDATDGTPTIASYFPQCVVPPPRKRYRPSCECRHFVLNRSEAHTSELQSLMRLSYAHFCLKKKTTKTHV